MLEYPKRFMDFNDSAVIEAMGCTSNARFVCWERKQTSLNDLYLEPEGDGERTFLCIGGGSGHYIASGSVDGQ